MWWMFACAAAAAQPAPQDPKKPAAQEQEAPEIVVEAKAQTGGLKRDEKGQIIFYEGYPSYDDEIKVIPLPVISFSGTTGLTFGGAVTLVAESRYGGAGTTYVPALIWNEETGFSGYFETFTDYGLYHHRRIVVEAATERNRLLDVSYVNLTGKDLGFLDGLDARLRHEVEGRSYFFGFGNRASEDTQGNYSSHEWDLHAYGYWQLGAAEKIETEKLMAYAGPYYRDMRIHTGIVSADGDIDKIDTYFPGLPGRTDGSGSLGVRGGFLYDTRDLEIVPHDGTLLDVYVELNERMRGEGPGFYPRYGVDGHHYFPIDDGIVLMVRGAFEGVSRDRSMPFYLRPALGGLGDLRAFRVGRWHDFFSAAINLDLRFHVTTFDLWGVPVELEMGPILDVGTVFNDFGSGAMDRVNFNPGLQVRLLNRPNLSMGLVGAYGRDGLEVAFGVGLPF